MMRGDLEEKVSELVEEGDELWDQILTWTRSIATEDGNIVVGSDEHGRQYDLLESYEEWYTEGRFLVANYLPERNPEFEVHHNQLREKLIRKPESESAGMFQRELLGPLTSQKAILKTIPEKVELERLKARRQVSEKITTDEIHRAEKLLEENQIRPAGVIAGVALERHLLTLCETADQDLSFGYKDGIASLAKTLSNAGAINNNEERRLEYLGGIRNDCSHANEEEPAENDVKRLINQAREFIQEHNTTGIRNEWTESQPRELTLKSPNKSKR